MPTKNASKIKAITGSHDSRLLFLRKDFPLKIMSKPVLPPIEQLTVSSLLAVTHTALGFGAGLLLAGKLRRSTQKTTAWTVFSIGLVSTLPVAITLLVRQLNRPESARAMKRRLESIRDDSGMSGENLDIF